MIAQQELEQRPLESLSKRYRCNTLVTGAGLAEAGPSRHTAPLTHVPSRLKNGALVHPFRAASSVGAVLTALPLALGALVAPTVAPPAAAAPGQVALASPQPLLTAQMDGIVLD